MRTFLVLAWLAVAGGVMAADDPWLIVPGKSVGQISLGMEQGELFKRLGTPTMQNDCEEMGRNATPAGDREGEVPVPKGVTMSDWTTTLSLSSKEDGINYLCDFVTVYVRDTKVVQIELRVRRFHDAHGLTSASKGAEWRKRYGPTKTFSCKYHHPSAGGIPATKHFMLYEDAVQAGVGWRCDAFGNLAPDPDPDGEVDTVIVHAPGEKLLVDPDGGSRFVWKDNPNRRAND